MKYILLFLVFVGIGMAAIIWYPKQTITPAPTSTNPTTIPPFSIQEPPSNALQGTMRDMDGDVLLQSRTATEPALLTSPVPVRQGELIRTAENGSVTVLFPGACSIDIGTDAIVDIIQTLPGHIVFRQDQGTVLYNAAPDCPLSVRTRRLLTVIREGTIAVNLSADSDLVSIRVRKGVAEVAYNDVNNVSTVIPVREGERFLFDNGERQGEVVRN